jgi:hypothetical protein
MNPASIRKMMVLAPTLALAVLLVQRNYDWIFGILIGTAVALSSCELIQKAVNNSFARRSGRAAGFFLFGFFFRFVFFAALLYAAIVLFKINPIAIAASFTIIQVCYPLYLVGALGRQQDHV